MEKNLNIRIGHLKIIDHLILGYSVSRLVSNGKPLHHSTIENIPMNSWEQISEGLKQGDLQGAFITVPLAMDLFAAGLDISFLMFVHRSGSLMIKNRKIQLKSLVDLKGKSILIPHELSVQHLLLHKLLAGVNLNQATPGDPGTGHDKVITEPITPFLMPWMVENDEELDIGACMIPEPYGSQAISRGVADRILTSDSLWKDHPCCGFVVQKSLGSSRAVEEIVHHFFQSAKALDTEIFNSRIDEGSFDFARNFLNQDPEIINQAIFKSKISYTPQKLLPDRKKLDIIQTYMTDTMGVMSRAVNLDSFINPVHATKAVSEVTCED